MGAFQQWLFRDSADLELIELAFVHEVQQGTAQYLERMAAFPPKLTSAEGCLEFQQELLQLVWSVEKIEAEATERVRDGDGDIAVRAEQFAAGRGARQLRVLGDALAWMVLGGNRAAVVALAQNDLPGRMYGKGDRGLQAEMDAVNRVWAEGHFAALHDLTNCLRIDDATVCNRLHRDGIEAGHPGCPDTDYGLMEIKADPHKKRSPDQRRRHEAALAAMNEGADLQTKTGPRRQFRWSGDYSAHQDQIGTVLDAAMADGVAAVQVEEGWVLTAVRIVGINGEGAGRDIKDVVETWEAKRAEAIRKAGFEGHSAHRVHSGDSAGRLLRCVPYALFPMAARTFAFLTSDWLMLDSTLSIPYLEARLQDAGMKVRRLTEDGSELEASIGAHGIQVKRSNVEDALLEGVSMGTYAAALADWAAQPGFAGHGELILPIG